VVKMTEEQKQNLPEAAGAKEWIFFIVFMIAVTIISYYLLK
jgi:hypothetical protein